jgi:hypothetical protein
VGNIVARIRKEPFHGDTINSLTHQKTYAYQWYSSLSHEKNLASKIWTTGMLKVGCMLEAFNFREIASLCVIKLNSKNKLIPNLAEGKHRILFNPNIFKRML